MVAEPYTFEHSQYENEAHAKAIGDMAQGYSFRAIQRRFEADGQQAPALGTLSRWRSTLNAVELIQRRDEDIALRAQEHISNALDEPLEPEEAKKMLGVLNAVAHTAVDKLIMWRQQPQQPQTIQIVAVIAERITELQAEYKVLPVESVTHAHEGADTNHDVDTRHHNLNVDTDAYLS